LADKIEAANNGMKSDGKKPPRLMKNKGTDLFSSKKNGKNRGTVKFFV